MKMNYDRKGAIPGMKHKDLYVNEEISACYEWVKLLF
jgi:hypothetical protein